MKGGAWGIAIAPHGSVWLGSVGGAAISEYSAAGTALSPSGGWTNGDPNHPQGMAVDQKGDVWIANNYGPESAPGQGNVIAYPGGDPSTASARWWGSSRSWSESVSLVGGSSASFASLSNHPPVTRRPATWNGRE